MNETVERPAARVLVVLAVVLFVAGAVAAAVEAGDGADVAEAPTSTTTVVGGASGGTSEAGQDPSVGPGATVPPVTTIPPTTVPLPPADEPLGPSVVPVAGTYRFLVRSTTDGTTEDSDEVREIERLSGDDVEGQVRVTSRVDDQGQVAIVDWSEEGAIVRSIQVLTTVGDSDECTYDPPVVEVSALAPRSSWTNESRCDTTINGVPTTIAIAGRAEVIGTARIEVGGVEVDTWQIRIDRTTGFRAEASGQQFGQEAREQGDLFLDPARGLVVYSDVTVTLSGQRSGTTRRVSELVG